MQALSRLLACPVSSPRYVPKPGSRLGQRQLRRTTYRRRLSTLATVLGRNWKRRTFEYILPLEPPTICAGMGWVGGVLQGLDNACLPHGMSGLDLRLRLAACSCPTYPVNALYPPIFPASNPVLHHSKLHPCGEVRGGCTLSEN